MSETPETYDQLKARADRHSAERLEALNCNARQAQRIAQLESYVARLEAKASQSPPRGNQSTGASE